MSAPPYCRVCGEKREDRFDKHNFMGSLMLVCRSCKARQLRIWEEGPKVSGRGSRLY